MNSENEKVKKNALLVNDTYMSIEMPILRKPKMFRISYQKSEEILLFQN